jgi:hypothetical protein
MQKPQCRPAPHNIQAEQRESLPTSEWQPEEKNPLLQRVLDRASGHMLNANLEQYKILRSRELPAIEVVVLENYQGMSSTDA